MLAMLLAGIVALADESRPVPGPGSTPPTPPVYQLPTGRLMLFSGNAHGASFLDLERTSKTGSKVDAWIFQVLAEPYNLSGNDPNQRVAQIVFHLALDCAKRDTFAELGQDGFNAAGQRVVWLPASPPESLEPSSMQEFVVRMMCDGEKPPTPTPVIGHEAAVQVTRQIFAQRKS